MDHAARRSLVREHRQALHIGSKVTRWFRKDREPNVLHVTPERVLAVLHKAGINCVLLGVHGFNVYLDQARATQDVDVLVTKRDVRKAVRVLGVRFPDLDVADGQRMTRFIDPLTQKSVIDVIKPASRALRNVFRCSIPIGKKYRIPKLEMALVAKYVSMTEPMRPTHKRLWDAGDFAGMVTKYTDAIDLQRLRVMADDVLPGNGAKILKFVEDAKADRTLDI